MWAAWSGVRGIWILAQSGEKSFLFILKQEYSFHNLSFCLCEVAQSCPTLCNPIDCSLPVSSVHGIFQARVLEWGAIFFSRGSSQPRDQTQVSYIVGRRFTVWATSVRWGKCRSSLWGLRWSLQGSAVFLLLVYVCACMLNHVWLFVIPWTVAHQAPLSMEFSRQESWSGLPFPSSGDLPDQGLNPRLLCLLHWQADSLPRSHQGSPLFLILSFYLISHLWLTQWQLHSGEGLSPWLPKPKSGSPLSPWLLSFSLPYWNCLSLNAGIL